MDTYDIWRERSTPADIWREYFQTLAAAARTGLYDIMAHPDRQVLGKDNGAADTDLRFFYEPAIEAFAEAGVTVEMSTASLRKPIGEIYLGPGLHRHVSRCRPEIRASSDAHEPLYVGHGYETAIELLGAHGITELAKFEGRTRTMEPIG